MNWYNGLYTGTSLLGMVDEVRRQVETDTCGRQLMIITSAANGEDQLDIRPASGWAKKCRLWTDPPVIVGLASDRAEALSLVQTMLETCVKETGDADLRSFLGIT